MASPAKLDKWGYERVGYDPRPVVAYAASAPATRPAHVNWGAWERRVASAALIAGLFWGLKALDPELRNLNILWETPGPLEMCGISALIWVHVWWRSSTRPK